MIAFGTTTEDAEIHRVAASHVARLASKLRAAISRVIDTYTSRSAHDTRSTEVGEIRTARPPIQLLVSMSRCWILHVVASPTKSSTWPISPSVAWMWYPATSRQLRR